MSFAKKLANLRPSWRAVVLLWKEEFSFKVQVTLAFGALVLAYALSIPIFEQLVLVLAIGAVLAIEAVNTAIEELCDHVTPQQHPQVAKIKDLGSGAALLMGVAATVVCAIIFAPKIIALA